MPMFYHTKACNGKYKRLPNPPNKRILDYIGQLDGLQHDLIGKIYAKLCTLTFKNFLNYL